MHETEKIQKIPSVSVTRNLFAILVLTYKINVTQIEKLTWHIKEHTVMHHYHSVLVVCCYNVWVLSLTTGPPSALTQNVFLATESTILKRQMPSLESLPCTNHIDNYCLTT